MALYTKITDIVAPSSAQTGDRVSVTIKIQNTWTVPVHVSAIGVLDSYNRFIDWLDYWIPAGVTHSFSGHFIMPNEDVTINAYSYYEGEDPATGLVGWYFDDSKSKSVRLEAAPVEYWHEIGTAIRRVVSVKITPPEVPPEVEVPYWHEIGDTVSLSVAFVEVVPPPEIEHWHEIGTAIRRVVSVKITPPEVPPEEVPPEVEKEIPWGTIALVGGGVVALAALAKRGK